METIFPFFWLLNYRPVECSHIKGIIAKDYKQNFMTEFDFFSQQATPNWSEKVREDEENHRNKNVEEKQGESVHCIENWKEFTVGIL